MTKGSAYKIAILALVGLIILWLTKSLFFPTNYGMGVNMTGNYRGGNMYMGTGLGYGLSISLLLTYLIKFLFVVFAIGLVGGLVAAGKNYIFTPEDIEAFKAPFTGNKSSVNKVTCTECGKELNSDWKSCPYCGTSVEKAEQ